MCERTRSLAEVTAAPQEYKLGEVAVSLRLPRKPQSRGNGKDTTPVTFTPDQLHRTYLREGNQFPIESSLEAQNAVYARQRFSGDEHLVIANTTSPYTTEGDHLIIWATNGFRYLPTLEDISTDQGRALFTTLADISDIYSRAETGPHQKFFFGFNINPDETERQAVQSIKTVHTHAVRLTDADVESFTSLPARNKAELADPLSSVGLHLFNDLVAPQMLRLGQEQGLVIDMITNYPYKYPQAAFFRLASGWDTLRDERFFDYLVELQRVIRHQYTDVAECFTTGRSEWLSVQVGSNGSAAVDYLKRPGIYSQPVIERKLADFFSHHPELSVESQQDLISLATRVRSASDVVAAHAREYTQEGIPIVPVQVINTRLFLDGPAYNLLLFPHPDTNDSLLAVVPRFLSGGSPLDAFGIKKTQYEVTVDELADILKQADERRDRIVNQLMELNPQLEAGAALVGIPTDN